MTSGFRHNLKAGDNRDNLRGGSKAFAWRDCRRLQKPSVRTPSSENDEKQYALHHNILDTNRDTSKALSTRSTELPVSGLPATWNTSQAIDGFHTVEYLREVSRRQSHCPLSCQVARDSRTTQLHVSFPTGDNLHNDSKHYYYYSVVCLTTGPKPLPKRFLHIVRSKASSFK